MTTKPPGDRTDAQPAKAELARVVAVGAAIIALYLVIQDWQPLVAWIRSPLGGV